MYVLVVIASFHPRFLTKFDRAYRVKCFYSQNDKDVESGLEIG